MRPPSLVTFGAVQWRYLPKPFDNSKVVGFFHIIPYRPVLWHFPIIVDILLIPEHAQVSTTTNVYTHVFKNTDERNAEILESLF